MEWLYPIALRIIAAVALLYFGLGLFNIHWLMRIRILASLGAGALLVGAIGYVFLRPEDPLGAISLFTGHITIIDALLVILLGLLAGAAATLACYPIGTILGPYAAPAGLGVLALFTGGIKQLLLTNASFEQRNALYGTLRFESLLWLAVCAAGYAAVLLTTKLTHKKAVVLHPEAVPQKKNDPWVNALIAVVVAAAGVYFTIGIFVRDIRRIDEKLGYVVGMPGNGQIAFGVFVSVGLAAFLAKRFLRTHFIPVIIGVIALYIGLFTKLIGSETLRHIVEQWPVDFFPHAIYAITPIQFVSFSVLGAITGYWTAVRALQKPAEQK
jgi:hypothetical protein